jgi:hypothetical protein
MKRLFVLAVAALLGMSASAWAGSLFCNHGVHCITPPCDCPDCSSPCEHRHSLAIFGGRADKIICELTSGESCCERIKAAKKLGCRLHADFCSCPEVLNALVAALQCDPCWEVRREAAWAIAMQGARTEEGLLALYIASKLDHHFLVRDRAIEALDILTLCRKACYVELFKNGDNLIKELKAQGYRPGTANCRVLFGGCCAAAGIPVSTPAAAPAGELLPVPPQQKLPSGPAAAPVK